MIYANDDIKIKKLVENEIDWLIGDPTYENIQSIIEFFSSGGFGNYSNDRINLIYENLMAKAGKK